MGRRGKAKFDGRNSRGKPYRETTPFSRISQRLAEGTGKLAGECFFTVDREALCLIEGPTSDIIRTEVDCVLDLGQVRYFCAETRM